LVGVLVDTRTELLELAVRSGLQVLETLLEDDRPAVCGPRDAYQADRAASRAGPVPSEVVLGGRNVPLRRPRVRAGGREVAWPTGRRLANTDPLSRRGVEQMLVGVATRQDARSLEPIGEGIRSRSTRKSAVSRRVVEQTAAQLEAGRSTPLDGLDLVALVLEGVQVAEHGLVVALGITSDGRKHALGLWDGSTENATVCQELLANLQSRGLRTDRSLLVILDGAKARRKAVRATFGEGALVQRCQVPKRRTVLEHLSERQRAWGRAILRRAYRSDRVATAPRLVPALVRRLDAVSPSAAGSLREGLDETLTVLSLGLSDRLRRSLATTNAAESLISRPRQIKRNVKRWRGGKMVVRWVAAGVLEAAQGFRRLKGHADMPTLVTALRARDRQLGFVASTEATQKIA
jgi:transposase-like protein